MGRNIELHSVDLKMLSVLKLMGTTRARSQSVSGREKEKKKTGKGTDSGTREGNHNGS